MAMLQEFRKFIARGNVIDLAVGIIVGAAFTTIVNSLVNDIIMPPLGMAIGGIDFSDFFIALNGEKFANLKAAQAAGAPVIAYGVFINAMIRFLIVSFAVFILVKQVNRFHQTETPGPTKQETLLEEIRDLLKQKKI